METTLYELCVEAGFELDLYIKDCPAARTLLSQHGQKFELFLSELDGLVWIEVPFAYQPFWDEKTKVG